MPLPSQSSRGRGQSSIRFSVRKRRKRKGPLPKVIAFAVVVTAVTVGGWFMFLREPEVTGDQIAQSTGPSGTEPEATRNEAEPPQTNIPAISMTPIEQPLSRRVPSQDRTTAPPPEREIITATPPLDEERETPIQRTPTTQSDDASESTPVRTLSHFEQAIRDAERSIEQQRLPIARDLLNRTLFDDRTTEAQRAELRSRLESLAETLTFSRAVVPGDDTVRSYRIQPGDRLSQIAVRENVGNSWQFVARVNGIADPGRIRVGQQIKIVNGPFHAVVHKRAYRLDLFLEDRDSSGNHLFVRSFDVGLGEYDSTPTGSWIVRNREKNPSWVNPRNPAERYERDDPMNPIGDFWVGLDGTDELTRLEVGYGLHGTIDPDSIGQQQSMGCVRLLDDDIELIFEVMVPEQSRVVIAD